MFDGMKLAATLLALCIAIPAAAMEKLKIEIYCKIQVENNTLFSLEEVENNTLFLLEEVENNTLLLRNILLSREEFDSIREWASTWEEVVSHDKDLAKAMCIQAYINNWNKTFPALRFMYSLPPNTQFYTTHLNSRISLHIARIIIDAEDRIDATLGRLRNRAGSD